jgi:hypothetical protein
MTTTTRAGALLEKLNNVQVRVSKNQGGSVEYWPNINGFDIVDMDGGSKLDTGYSEVAYQHFDTGVIIDFDNNHEDNVGEWEYTHLGVTESGVFSDGSDVEDVLKDLPKSVKKINAGLYKRLPQPKGWVLDEDVVSDVSYSYKVDADYRISLTIYNIGNVFEEDSAEYVANMVDDGGHKTAVSQEKEGEFTSLRDLETLMASLVKDYSVNESAFHEDDAKDAARELSNIIPNFDNIIRGKSEAGYVALMLDHGLVGLIDGIENAEETLADYVAEYEPQDDRSMGSKENVQRKLWLVRQLNKELGKLNIYNISSKLSDAFKDKWPSNLEEALSLDNMPTEVHEAGKKPNAGHISALTRQLKKLLPEKYKSMMGSAFAGGVMVYYVKEEDARHAVALLRENEYEAESLGYGKNMGVWTIAALPKGFSA